MNAFENRLGMEGPQNFRGLVGNLVEGSDLFPIKTIGKNEQMTILDAIENNEVSLYVPERADDKMLDAVHCLVTIYDELKKQEPDQDFITSTVKQLKEYL